jgi:hypothetical protein
MVTVLRMVITGLTFVSSLLLLFRETVFAQVLTTQFGRVLPLTESLSGNFGEIRSNHFHSGLDYKTSEKEGLPVFAAADGYVSRVKVSSNGYGKAIYITHPNDIVTVYGHLRAFYPAIADTIEKLQLANKAFPVELFPDSNFYPVKANQVIAFSGNSGSSEGPHLHFETRHQYSEKPVDPVIFGYGPVDTVKPVIQSLHLYTPGPFNGMYLAQKRSFSVLNFQDSDTIMEFEAGQKFIVGFEAFDLAGSENNQLGNRKFELFKNDTLIFSAAIDSFSFDETRLVNSAIDYKTRIDSGNKIILCYKLPGNMLPFYTLQGGIIELDKKHPVLLKLVVSDHSKNQSSIIFKVKYSRKFNKKQRISSQLRRKGIMVSDNKQLSIIKSDYSLVIPEKTFYEKGMISVTGNSTKESPLKVDIQTFGLAINKPLELSLKIKQTDQISKDKLTGVFVNSEGKLSSATASMANGIMNFKVRNSGTYFVIADTTAPEAGGPTVSEDIYSGSHKITIPLKNDISGISRIDCLINEEYVVAEYNSYRNEVTVYLKQRYKSKSLIPLSIKMVDGTGNELSKHFNVTIP